MLGFGVYRRTAEENLARFAGLHMIQYEMFGSGFVEFRIRSLLVQGFGRISIR